MIGQVSRMETGVLIVPEVRLVEKGRSIRGIHKPKGRSITRTAFWFYVCMGGYVRYSRR